MNNKSEIRKSYFGDKEVIIAPKRAKRPQILANNRPKGPKQSPGCPFCVKNINQQNIVDYIGGSTPKNWEVLSIKNIFPAVTIDNLQAQGQQEVIIDTPNHNKKPSDLSLEEIRLILKMYQQRTLKLSKNKNLDYILCLKNHGLEAGASIDHPHSQVFATKIVPPELQKESLFAKKYWQKNKSCIYCDTVKKEIRSKRKIYADNNVVAFSPYASEYQYEAWIFPRRHIDNITLLTEKELISLAKILKRIFRKLDKLNLSFNYFLHNVVSNKNQHFYIKIEPRASIWAGVELASGLIINSISPEQAAKYYRE